MLSTLEREKCLSLEDAFAYSTPGCCHLICVPGNGFSSAAWHELWADTPM